MRTQSRDVALGLALEEDAMVKKLNPMHPGEVLREEFLVPLKMSAGPLGFGLRLASHTDRADRQRRHYRRYCASTRQGARHDGTALAQSAERL